MIAMRIQEKHLSQRLAYLCSPLIEFYLFKGVKNPISPNEVSFSISAMKVRVWLVQHSYLPWLNEIQFLPIISLLEDSLISAIGFLWKNESESA